MAGTNTLIKPGQSYDKQLHYYRKDSNELSSNAATSTNQMQSQRRVDQSKKDPGNRTIIFINNNNNKKNNTKNKDIDQHRSSTTIILKETNRSEKYNVNGTLNLLYTKTAHEKSSTMVGVDEYNANNRTIPSPSLNILNLLQSNFAPAASSDVEDKLDFDDVIDDVIKHRSDVIGIEQKSAAADKACERCTNDTLKVDRDDRIERIASSPIIKLRDDHQSSNSTSFSRTEDKETSRFSSAKDYPEDNSKAGSDNIAKNGSNLRSSLLPEDSSTITSHAKVDKQHENVNDRSSETGLTNEQKMYSKNNNSNNNTTTELPLRSLLPLVHAAITESNDNNKKSQDNGDSTCTHSNVLQNATLRGNLHSGKFTDRGEMDDIKQCARLCCMLKACDLAFMLENKCFTVQCKNKALCEPVQARSTKFSPVLCYVLVKPAPG